MFSPQLIPGDIVYGGTVQADDGAMLPLDSLAKTYTYSGTLLTSITITFGGNGYQQIFINDGTNIIYASNWMLI